MRAPPSLRWSSRTWSSSAAPAASSACAATPKRSSWRPASACGGATWCPSPGEPGSETWPADGEAWARGGANCWVTPTFDPDLNLLYYGTGNPCPDFDGAVREGDNLYTDSGVAVDADTGEIKAHFQYTPHDLWDYDSTMEHILFDLDGQKLAAHFDKNGFLYILDRTTCRRSAWRRSSTASTGARSTRRAT